MLCAAVNMGQKLFLLVFFFLNKEKKDFLILDYIMNTLFS